MSSMVKFSSTKLVGTGKKGILNPDANGYYTLPVGGLNAFNSAGEYYLLEGAKQLFEESGSLMRRVKSGCLKGEVGHPPRLPGMSYEEYAARLMQVRESNVCAHFAEFWLDLNFGRDNPSLNNPSLVAIMSRVKPAGPHGAALEAAFKNGEEDVCFSIRAVTKDYIERAQRYRVLHMVFTFDWVTEPGISIARKYHSPALETLNDVHVSRSELLKAVSHIKQDTHAIESSVQIANETLAVYDRITQKQNKPFLSNW